VVGAADPGLEDHARPDLDAADLAEGFPVEHVYGTSTRSRIRSTTVSLVTFSASAS
jgi:hypothetical protein